MSLRTVYVKLQCETILVYEVDLTDEQLNSPSFSVADWCLEGNAELVESLYCDHSSCEVAAVDIDDDHIFDGNISFVKGRLVTEDA